MPLGSSFHLKIKAFLKLFLQIIQYGKEWSNILIAYYLKGWKDENLHTHSAYTGFELVSRVSVYSTRICSCSLTEEHCMLTIRHGLQHVPSFLCSTFSQSIEIFPNLMEWWTDRDINTLYLAGLWQAECVFYPLVLTPSLLVFGGEMTAVGNVTRGIPKQLFGGQFLRVCKIFTWENWSPR